MDKKKWEHWVLGTSAHGIGPSPVAVVHAKASNYKAERGVGERSTQLSPIPLFHATFLQPAHSGAHIWPVPCPLDSGGKSPLAKNLSQSSTCHQGPKAPTTRDQKRSRNATRTLGLFIWQWDPERSLAEEWRRQVNVSRRATQCCPVTREWRNEWIHNSPKEMGFRKGEPHWTQQVLWLHVTKQPTSNQTPLRWQGGGACPGQTNLPTSALDGALLSVNLYRSWHFNGL